MDQAQRLRELAARIDTEPKAENARGFFAEHRQRIPRIVTCAAGEAEPLYPYLLVNMAVGLAKYAPPLLILDASLDAGPLCDLLGGRPRRTLEDLAGSNGNLADLLVEGPAGTNLMLAGNRLLADLDRLNPERLAGLLEPLRRLKRHFSLVLLNVEVGLTFPALNLLLASQEVVLFATGSETARKNCYLLIKILDKKNPRCRIGLVGSQMACDQEGHAVARRLASAARKFLNHPVTELGVLVRDQQLTAAHQQHRFFTVERPGGRLGKSIDNIAEKIYYTN